MPEEISIILEPDLQFIKEIATSGGESLKKCYQCATCSVVCALSPEKAPFPRKEMIWGQWGLKNKLISDPDVWLCHQCGDCTTYCPRGAKPGDVLAAVRSVAIRNYSFPKFMGEMLADPKSWWKLILAPALLILVYMFITLGGIHIPKGEVHYAGFFPHLWLNVFFMTMTGLMVLAAGIGLFQFWKDMAQVYPRGSENKTDLFQAARATFKEICTHIKFTDCVANKFRYWAHLGIFYGFIILLFVTSIAVVAILIGLATGSELYPFGFWNPFKMIGNIGALALLGGCCYMIWLRFQKTESLGQSKYFDWFFLLVLTGVAITGILVEWLRFANGGGWAYFIYFIHLVLVFDLLIYLPFSKFAHLIYRGTAIFYDKYKGGLSEEAK